MEDVLAVYTRPFDERFPQLCMDEGCKQLVRSKREALPMRPGQAACEDYEYEPQGWCNVFVVCEPLGGRRFLQVYERRTKEEWASFMREVIDEQYPQAEKIILVMDNLNTHTTASFYEVFTPEEAFRLSQKLEIHYTPRHGSWLNMAEIELSVLARQALAERLATMAQVQARVAAWQQRRNQQQAGISWRFTSQDARIKLARLYPSLEA
jgi:hypothetical protein